MQRHDPAIGPHHQQGGMGSPVFALADEIVEKGKEVTPRQ
jgi:hypothetical protein